MVGSHIPVCEAGWGRTFSRVRLGSSFWRRGKRTLHLSPRASGHSPPGGGGRSSNRPRGSGQGAGPPLEVSLWPPNGWLFPVSRARAALCSRPPAAPPGLLLCRDTHRGSTAQLRGPLAGSGPGLSPAVTGWWCVLVCDDVSPPGASALCGTHRVEKGHGHGEASSLGRRQGNVLWAATALRPRSLPARPRVWLVGGCSRPC